MFLTVYDLEQEPLFTGTKQDCKHYIKCRKLVRGTYSIAQSRTKIYTDATPIIETTAPIESKPVGFWKRLFR